MQEHYYQLVVTPSSHHELFSDFLADTLPIGFEELDQSFIVRNEDELDTIAWGIEQFAEALTHALATPVDVELTHTKEINSDWIQTYQESITPIEIEKFYIHPTWNDPSDSHINIVIDPALAFGTGHHPTTASSLKAISKYTKEGDEVIDVGCGSGILGIGAIKLGAHVDACDTDIISVENTKENALLNDVEFRHLYEGSINDAKSHYDVIVANIVADVLVFIARDLKKSLKKDGILILSGILDKYEDKVLRKYKDLELVEKIELDEWRTLVLKNR